MKEKRTQNDILRAFGSKRSMRLWRANILAARMGDRFVRAGVPGQADLTGILPGGRRLEIEIKSATGRQTADQRAFQAMIERFGEWPVVADGEIVDPQNATLEEKRAVYHGFVCQAAMKGFKPGWAAYRYKDIFGCWPRGFVQDVRREAMRERFQECART